MTDTSVVLARRYEWLREHACIPLGAEEPLTGEVLDQYVDQMAGLPEGGSLVASAKPASGLADRLADCLAEIIDATLYTVRDVANDKMVDVQVGSFRKDLSERAAVLLEEAGR